MGSIEDLRHASDLLQSRDNLRHISHRVSQLELDMQILREHLDQEIKLLPKVDELKVLAHCQTEYLRRLQGFADEALTDVIPTKSEKPLQSEYHQQKQLSGQQHPISNQVASPGFVEDVENFLNTSIMSVRSTRRDRSGSAGNGDNNSSSSSSNSSSNGSNGNNSIIKGSSRSSSSSSSNSDGVALTEKNPDRLRYLRQVAANRSMSPSSPRRVPVNPLRRSISDAANNAAMIRPPTLAHISKEELKRIPQYMRGRNSAERINEVLDIINGLITEKYTIMRMRQTEMSNQQLKKWKRWQRQEPKRVPGSSIASGSHTPFFFVDQDITEHKNFRMDASGKAVLHVLRHTGRIKEDRDAQGVTRFFIQQQTPADSDKQM